MVTLVGAIDASVFCCKSDSLCCGQSLCHCKTCPLYDFHWYRLMSDSKWTHKPDWTEVTKLNAKKKKNTDPKKCNRDYRKNKRAYYNKVCSYMCVPRGTINDDKEDKNDPSCQTRGFSVVEYNNPNGTSAAENSPTFAPTVASNIYQSSFSIMRRKKVKIP